MMNIRLKIQLYIVLFICTLISQPVQASCYTPGEAAAEQALRLHSELLVIGLNCRHLDTGNRQDSYETYRAFTARHADTISRYENDIVGYYTRQGHKDPAQNLNTMRTEMANNLAELAVKIRPDVFCHKYMPRLYKAAGMTRADIHEWATTYFPSAPPSQEYCLESSR